MKEKILKLREEGKSYRDIEKELGCSKGLISYYCGKGQKEKTKINNANRRKGKGLLMRKLESFKYRLVYRKFAAFQQRTKCGKSSKRENNFTLEDVENKIGENPICYLSGRKIDLSNGKSFHFDHIIPVAKGGSNTIDNLGITDASVNKMKSDLLVEELLNVCKEILEYNGYKVEKCIQ